MKFYDEFEAQLKMGCQEDDSNRSKISKLLRFSTTKSSQKKISLDTYLERMQENQDHIYFMSGESVDIMEKSPNLQVFRKKDLEVVFLDGNEDEHCFQRLSDYEGKKLISIQKADLKMFETDEDKKTWKKIGEMYKPLTKWYKELLKDLTENGSLKDTGVTVGEVELSKRLVKSPCTVVSSSHGYTAKQEKQMKANNFQNKDLLKGMLGRKNFELNPHHPVIADLLEKVNKNKADDAATKESAQILFQTSLIEQGYDLPDPSLLVNRVYRLMSKELGVDPDEPIKEVEVPEDDEEEEEEDNDDDEENEEDTKDEEEGNDEKEEKEEKKNKDEL